MNRSQTIMNKKKYNRLSRDEKLLLRKRFNTLLKEYKPRMVARIILEDEFNVSDSTIARILREYKV